MKIITINLPEKYLEAIKTLNDLGVYASRSEAIRNALSQFLDDELKMFENLEDRTFRMLVRSNQKNRS